MTFTGDWAEGDALTPTNLSAKGGGNFPDRIYNAGWARFGASSVAKETRIQAAITQAVADGVPAVFVPASMLPYDANAVTFNTGVHMLREGGDQTLAEFDVEAYGAALNQDSYTAIQTCLNYAGSPYGKATVRLPNGARSDRGYKLSKPLQLVNHSRLVGPREGVNTSSTGGGAWLQPTYKYGYALAVMDNSTMPGLGASLATGSGQSWSPGGITTRFFNLRDSASLDINGLTAFTVAGFFRPTAADLASGLAIFSGGGSLTPTLRNSRAFHIQTSSAKLLIHATTSTTGTITSLAGSTVLTAGATYYFEASWDGSTLRLFVGQPGSVVTLDASTALTGTLVQAPYEECAVGAWGFTSFAETNPIVGGVNGPISSLHISNIARHTATFTAPTAEHTPDANTLALMNWDEQVGHFTKVYVGASDVCWAFLRHQDTAGGVAGWEISGVNFTTTAANTASGIVIGPNSPNGFLDRIYMKNVRTGLRGPLRDSYMTRFSNVFIDATGGWYAVATNGNNAQALHWDTLVVFGGRILFAAPQGANTFNNCFFQTAAATEIGVILATDGTFGTTANGCIITTEVVPATSYLASLVVTGQFTGTGYGTLEWNGGYIAGARGVPPLLCSQNATVGFHGTTFVPGTATSIMAYDAAKPSKMPVRFDGCWQNGTWVKWSDTAGTAVVGRIGKNVAVTYSATPTFACDVRDEFEITLTGDCAPTITKVTPGQSILVTIIQDAVGNHSFTWPANVKGGGAVGTASNNISQQRFTAMLDDPTNPTLMADAAIVRV